MGNRFGFKDFLLLTFIVLLILVIILGMKQLDRQWAQLQTLQSQGADQTRLLASIQHTLEDGITVNNRGGASNNAGPSTHGDPFGNLKEAEKKPDFARGDWLIDNFMTKLPKVTPIVSSDLYADWVQVKVIETLAYRDPDTFEYHPQLATDWQIVDNSEAWNRYVEPEFKKTRKREDILKDPELPKEEGAARDAYIEAQLKQNRKLEDIVRDKELPAAVVVTFQLRKGIRFSDGEPLTADDVVFSYELVMNPKIDAARQRAYLAKIRSVRKKGENEVVFEMNEPYFEYFDLCGTMSIVPKHFYSKYDAEEFNTNPGLLMGTGPYKLRDPAGWRPGQKVDLIRNDLYWGVSPTFDHLVFLEVQEEAAEETMFGNRELDVFATQPEQYKRLLADPKTTGRANHFEYDSPMNGYGFIAWNQSRKGQPTRFADPRVRRAMTMLTDREAIIRDVYLGYATLISGPFATGSPQADPNIKPWPYDPAGAKKLLAEAGFEDRDGSGVVKGADGQPFRFKLTYGSGNATFERVVLFLKDSYAKAGIILEPNPVDWPILVKSLDTRDFEAITLQWGGGIESDLYQEFDSSQIADGGDNFMSYINPKLDALMREARRTVDDAKRMKLWQQAHAILHEDQPYTFLNSRKSLRFMDNRIQNVKLSKLGLNYIYRYNMPIPWYVPKPMQKYKK